MPESALRAVPLALILTVPTDCDPLDIAQEAADAVRDLQRAETGERYAASVEIAVPYTQPDEFEIIVTGASARMLAGHRLLFLAFLIWARRPWDDDGVESDAVMIDTRQAVATMCASRWPQTDPPAGMPIDLHTIQIAAISGRIARTTSPRRRRRPTRLPELNYRLRRELSSRHFPRQRTTWSSPPAPGACGWWARAPGGGPYRLSRTPSPWRLCR